MRLAKRGKDGGILFLTDDRRPSQSLRARRSERPAASCIRSKVDDFDARFRAALTAERQNTLAAALGVTAPALDTLGVGWAVPDDLKALLASGAGWQENRPDGAYSFAERDGGGRIVGFSFRTGDGRKGSPSSSIGSRRGLIVPNNLHQSADPVLVVEGASDVAACIVLGVAAVGRPSNSSGAADLINLLDSRDLLIVGENDSKSSGAWPGRDGAKSVQRAWQPRLPQHGADRSSGRCRRRERKTCAIGWRPALLPGWTCSTPPLARQPAVNCSGR
jgi:hypothetical protein